MKVKIVRFFKRYVKYFIIFLFILQLSMLFSDDSNRNTTKTISNFFEDPVDHLNRLNSEYEQKILMMRNSAKLFSVFHKSGINLGMTVHNMSKPEKNDLFLNSEQNVIFDQYKPSLPNHQERVIVTGEVRSNLKQVQYTILEYTNVGGGMRFCNMSFPTDIKEGHKEFRYLDKCAYSNCRFSCDKSLVSSADAFLTHLTDVEIELNQDFQARYNFFKIPRNNKQVWILWNDEANQVSEKMDQYKFNWTISFKIESEASVGAYGFVGRRIEKVDNLKLNNMVKKNFEKRKGQAIWFVSNCVSTLRNMFVVNLAAFSNVVVYGRCAGVLQTLITPGTKHPIFNTSNIDREGPEELNILHSNKFFLALENQNCDDYITEKFWRSLSFDIIPIVLQPAKNIYLRNAPPDSFIHLADFDYDVEKLGKYMEKVSSNITLYQKYFEWKKKYSPIYKPFDVEQARFCELCYRLNTMEQVGYYKSVSGFFNNQCQR